MTEAFYYSNKHIDLKDHPDFIGFDLEWMLSQYKKVYKHVLPAKRPTLSHFIASVLRRECK